MKARILGLFLVAALPGCGGGTGTGAGDFVESLVRLLSAQFVPASVTVPRGTTRTVDFEVVCDWSGLNTAFGRLGIMVKLDPDRSLPAGVTATVVDGVPDSNGFTPFPCTGTHPNPNLRITHVAVQVRAAPLAAPTTSLTLVGFVQIEPLISGDPSKDSTRADLAITILPGDVVTPTN